MSRLSRLGLLGLLGRPSRDPYMAANRRSRVNVAMLLAVGLVVPLLYGVALAVAAVVDAWGAGS